METIDTTSPVFVDASAWLARTNARDQHADAARRLLDRCFADDISLVTTNWTAYEALSMVKSRVGWEAASDLWALLSNPVVIEFAEVTPDFERRALELFFGYEESDPTRTSSRPPHSRPSRTLRSATRSPRATAWTTIQRTGAIRTAAGAQPRRIHTP